MTKHVSVGTMIEQLDALRDTKELSDWEHGFVTSVVEKYLLADKRTSVLSEKQVVKIEQLWQEHYTV